MILDRIKSLLAPKVITTGGRLRYWDGNVWTPKTLKFWTGSTWQIKTLKFWNGTTWI